MIKFKRSPFLRPENEYIRRKYTMHIVVHCSDTKAAWDGGAEEIREWHVHERGWMDIGYHFVIRRDGTIENGRPLWAVGAGVSGHNSAAIHICMVGGRSESGKAENNFTKEQFQALALLVSGIKLFHAPKAKVMGHRDFPKVSKACPSFDVARWWGGEEGIDVNRAVFPQWFTGTMS